MRVIFMGSPEFALPTLTALNGTYDLVEVITQPDRPAGRGRSPQASAVKLQALELGVPIYQPSSLKDPEARAHIQSLHPDLIVVAAFGQILPPQVLGTPTHGSLNVHASLLPRWRGAAPVQAAILHRDDETGVTIMQMDAGLDTGPILAQRSTPIAADETAGELSARLAELGAELLMDCLPAYLQGSLSPTPQDEQAATYAPMLRKRDGLLDFSLDAERLARQVRAYDPWPGSHLVWVGGRLLVRRAHAEPAESLPHGTPHVIDGAPAIAAAGGSLVLDLVQPPGRVAMSGEAFLRGAPHFLKDRLAPAPEGS